MKLIEIYPEYMIYKKRTGMFFPKLQLIIGGEKNGKA